MGKLTAKQVAAAKHPGTKPGARPRPVILPDGEGLFLQITPAGGKSWLPRYPLAGRTREAGLGSFGEKEARSKVQLMRAVVGHMRKPSKLPERVRSFFGRKTFR